MDKIALIKAEIERLYNDKSYSEDRWDMGYDCACEDIMSFLSTLSEEPDKSLEETAADFVWDVMENDYYGPSELSKRLRPTSKLDDFYSALAEIFIAGAKWQEGQLLKGSPLPEDTVLFQKGVEEGKRLMMEEWLKDRDGCFWDGVNEGKKAMEEQMMKEAVEGEITKDNRGNNVVRAGVFNKDFEYGDKVRIIIVKED